MIETWNDNPRPYVWIKTANQVLDSIAHYGARIKDFPETREQSEESAEHQTDVQFETMRAHREVESGEVRSVVSGHRGKPARCPRVSGRARRSRSPAGLPIPGLPWPCPCTGAVECGNGASAVVLLLGLLGLFALVVLARHLGLLVSFVLRQLSAVPHLFVLRGLVTRRFFLAPFRLDYAEVAVLARPPLGAGLLGHATHEVSGARLEAVVQRIDARAGRGDRRGFRGVHQLHPNRLGQLGDLRGTRELRGPAPQ